MSKEREVDLQGNCSKCGGVHFGTGRDCVYGKPEQNRTIPPTLQTGSEQPAQGEPSDVKVYCGKCGIEIIGGVDWHNCKTGVPSQPSAGERPRCSCCNYLAQAAAEFADASRADNHEDERKHRERYMEILSKHITDHEPSSPPATAGTARNALAALRQWEKDTEAPASTTEGNAFMDGFNARNAEVAELRQMLDKYAETEQKLLRRAERAERALREIENYASGIQQMASLLGAIADGKTVVEHVLAALKSSQEEGSCKK